MIKHLPLLESIAGDSRLDEGIGHIASRLGGSASMPWSHWNSTTEYSICVKWIKTQMFWWDIQIQKNMQNSANIPNNSAYLQKWSPRLTGVKQKQVLFGWDAKIVHSIVVTSCEGKYNITATSMIAIACCATNPWDSRYDRSIEILS